MQEIPILRCSPKRQAVDMDLTLDVRKFFSNIGQTLAISSDPQQEAYRRSISEFDYRIMLKITTRNKQYIIAVDDTFDKIHTDWNWVEKNLFLKVCLYLH